MIFTFFLLRLFLVVHIYLQQSDEHSKQDAKKLQIGAGLSHLATDKEKVMLPWHFRHFIDIWLFLFLNLNLTKNRQQYYSDSFTKLATVENIQDVKMDSRIIFGWLKFLINFSKYQIRVGILK